MQIDTGFRPSKHGFGFPNAWHDVLLGVAASRGRCGGMVFAALDRFAAGVPLTPAEQAAALPAHDAELARVIWRRQVESVATHLGSNLWRFAVLTYLPTHAPAGTAETTRREIPRLLEALEAGLPVPLGLVSGLSLRHLARNHQVLAYAVDVGDGPPRIRVYDPNLPRRDDVVLEVRPENPGRVIELVGARVIPWRGLFVERYAPAPAPGAVIVDGARAPVARRVSDTHVVLATALLGALAGAWLFGRRRKR